MALLCIQRLAYWPKIRHHISEPAINKYVKLANSSVGAKKELNFKGKVVSFAFPILLLLEARFIFVKMISKMLFHWRSAGYFSVAEFILVNTAENSWQKLATLRTEKKKPVLPTLNTNFSAILPTKFGCWEKCKKLSQKSTGN
jgi:hypothetical protein